jgi:hypothetical protein
MPMPSAYVSVPTYTSASTGTAPCQHCGLHHQGVCPRVKAIEYYPDGTVKRVEFKGASDYPPPLAVSLPGQRK